MFGRIRRSAVCLTAVLLLSGCGAANTGNLLEAGASKYGFGKTEEDYSIKTANDILEDLINKYSGSRYNPTGTQLTDAEREALRKAREKQKDDDDKSGSKSGDDDTSDDNAGDDSTGDDTAGNTADDDTSGDTAGDDTSGDDDASVEEEKIPEVADMDDLLSIFRDLFKNNRSYVAFTTVNGFVFDPYYMVESVYWVLEREDPLNVLGAKSWSWYNYNVNDYEIYMEYFYTDETMAAMKSEAPSLVDEAVRRIGAQGLSDYEIIYAVNEYLCDNVYYPETEPYEPITHTAYGALKNGCAVCEGYSCAAKAILNRYGIECDIEFGTVKDGGGGHAWNLVKIDDVWYQLDVTWNDASDRSLYFLMTDDYMKETREWDYSLYPECSKISYAELMAA